MYSYILLKPIAMGGRVGEAMELLQHPPSSQPIHSKQYIHVHLHFYIPINATHTI